MLISNGRGSAKWSKANLEAGITFTHLSSSKASDIEKILVLSEGAARFLSAHYLTPTKSNHFSDF